MIKVSTTPDASGAVVFLAWTYSSVSESFIRLLQSAKDEILATFSTANAFRRQERVGSLELLKEATRRGVNVRILTPEDHKIADIKLNLESQKIDIRYIEESSQISFIIGDRKSSLVIELKDDSKRNYLRSHGICNSLHQEAHCYIICLNIRKFMETSWIIPTI